MTPIYRPSVYTASKLHHAPLWRTLRDNHPEIEWTARWVDHPEYKERSAGPAEFAHHWTVDIQDVQRSEFVLFFGGPSFEPPDALKGAFVEAGAALGAGKLVLAVNCPTSWSWTYHPRVVRFLTLDEVFDFLHSYYIIPRHRGETQ